MSVATRIDIPFRLAGPLAIPAARNSLTARRRYASGAGGRAAAGDEPSPAGGPSPRGSSIVVRSPPVQDGVPPNGPRVGRPAVVRRLLAVGPDGRRWFLG